MTEEKEKQLRLRVRDGYAFCWLGAVKQPDGSWKKFPVLQSAAPAKSGEIILVTESQIAGQEHKLERSEKVQIICGNSTCGKQYESAALEPGRAYCPHCGGKGGTITVAEAAVPEKKEKEKEARVPAKPDADRMDKEPEEERSPLQKPVLKGGKFHRK